MQATLQDRLQIEIRRMKMGDLQQIMTIEPVAYGNHHWSVQSFENELRNELGYYFAALIMDTHELIGYSGFWLVGEEAHITTLAVHPQFRRRSVGERLLINNIFEAKKVKARWLTLEVRVSNEKALSLYFKYGFKSLSVRKSYYQDNGEDAPF